MTTTGEAIAKLSLYAATFVFGANEIRKDRNTLKKQEARREKLKKMTREEQMRFLRDEVWEA